MLDFARDKRLWEKIRTSDEFIQHRKEVKELYEKAFKVEPRAHSAKEILENNDNGLWRLQFDHLQSSAILSLIYPDNEEYYDNLLKSVWAYLDDYTWAPLGHYTKQYYGKTPKDFDFGLIDIFASSAALALAEIKSLFQDRFPKLLIDRITYELRRRTIEPYLTRKYFWESHDNNWTAVCTGAVGSVLIYESPQLYYENRERLHASMKCYLDSYKDDGMCVEGVGYWSFGFGFFVTFAMLEKELTNGEVDWFKEEKVKEISKFIQKTFLQRNVLVSFSDAGIDSPYSFGLPHMLKHIYGDEIENLPPDHGIAVYDNTHFNFALRSFIYYSKDFLADKMSNDVTYSVENSSYLFKRTENYGFAVKGGNNGESHNHIDVGSFILARNDKQIICDLGAGPYEDGYHTERRYTFFNPSAYAHNIPMLNGVGEDSVRREDVCVNYDWEKERASLEFSNAFGVDFLTKAERTFDFKKDSITMIDTLEVTKETDITERFVSVIEPKMVDGVAVIDDVSLIVQDNLQPKITLKEVKRHLDGSVYNAYLIDYTLPKGKYDFKITFSM